MNKTDDEYSAAIDRAFEEWRKKYDPENKLKPIEQVRQYIDYIRAARGLPPRRGA
jgi:hypothetical protein